MFPAHNGLYGHRSTMNQYAKPGYPYFSVDPYPFTNADLKSPFLNPGDDFDQVRDDNQMSIKK
jgi:hypothetical protein